MEQRKPWMQRLADLADLGMEPLPGVPVIEVAGESRVLVEKHGGVTEYSDQRIGIRVSYGEVLVCGSDLKLAQMTGEQLVILGKIECVQLLRRRL